MNPNPQPAMKESISKRTLAGTKMPILSPDEIGALTLRVEALLSDHFGPHGYATQEQFDELSESLQGAMNKGWAQSLRGTSAMLKNGANFMALMGALMLGLDVGVRPEFDAVGVLEYEILSVVEHLGIPLRPHDWSSVAAPHNWPFYLILLDNIICAANGCALARRYIVEHDQQPAQLHEHFQLKVIPSIGNQVSLKLALNEFQEITATHNQEAESELEMLRRDLEQIQGQNQQLKEMIQELEDREESMATQRENLSVSQEQVLHLRNELMAVQNQEESLIEALKQAKQTRDALLVQLQEMEQELSSRPFSEQEAHKLREEHKERWESVQEKQRLLAIRNSEYDRMQYLYEQQIPLYMRVLQFWQELLRNSDLDDPKLKEISHELKQVIEWASQALERLRELVQILENKKEMDFELLENIEENYNNMAKTVLKGQASKLEKTLDERMSILKEKNVKDLELDEEESKLARQLSQEKAEIERWAGKNENLFNSTKAQLNHLESKLEPTLKQRVAKRKNLQELKESRQHYNFKIEMLVREIEMLKRKHEREIIAAQRSSQKLVNFIRSENLKTMRAKIQETRDLLTMFQHLGHSSRKDASEFVERSGLKQELLDEINSKQLVIDN